MSRQDITQQLIQTVDELSEPEALQGLFHEHREGDPLPSAKELEEIIDLSRSILFPGFYGKSSVNIETIKYQIGVSVERLHKLLSRQVMAGLCFDEDCHCPNADDMRRCMQEEADMIAERVIAKFPTIRKILSTDIQAAFDGDPAAANQGEVISCYPAIKAIINYRLAHELVMEDVPLIPRMITEMAHSETGIDIHPAATIGTHFTIDHGTGVVIGATCVIGNHVKLYQGVTLGARSFPLDKDGKPSKAFHAIRFCRTMSSSMPMLPFSAVSRLEEDVLSVPMYGLPGICVPARRSTGRARQIYWIPTSKTAAGYSHRSSSPVIAYKSQSHKCKNLNSSPKPSWVWSKY